MVDIQTRKDGSSTTEILDHIENVRKAWTYFRRDTNSWAKHDEMLNILTLDTKISSLLEK